MKNKRTPYTEKEIKTIIRMFPDHYTIDICKKLDRSYSSVCFHAYKNGLKKSEAFMRAELKKQGERIKKLGKAYRFPKGHVSHNKGKKMDASTYEKVRPTMFKKGSTPPNALPIGTEVIRKDKGGRDYIMIKIKGRAKLDYKQKWIWEQVHGPIKKGYNVVFKDGNTMNCCIENLECISDAELMERNTIHRFPEELKTVIRLVKKLNKTIDATEQN